ncbi:MAG: hypothetical protein VX152_12060, partial [Pseudomonadota bacterium]|nr:hypothetical protein [Pseudomonadota bacterium]
KVLYGELAMDSYDWDEPPGDAELAALTAEIERLESSDAKQRVAAPLVPPAAPPSAGAVDVTYVGRKALSWAAKLLSGHGSGNGGGNGDGADAPRADGGGGDSARWSSG